MALAWRRETTWLGGQRQCGRGKDRSLL